MIICSSMLSRLPTGMEATWRWATGLPDIAAETCEAAISERVDSTAARATRLRNSRTLPGQACASSAETASAENELREFFSLRKCSASAITSSGRSRSGGTRS